MSRMTIDFGIDLGTTNSAIAVKDGNGVTVIKNNESSEITPSAVWIDRQNRLYVGKRAKQRAEMDSENVQTEFKLQMGTRHAFTFRDSHREMLPEELSAEVLKSLRADVKVRMNEDLTAAVITVPAAFELPQNDATRRAALEAGISFSPLIMEPTAAAMAYAYNTTLNNVFWMVYDFGGGTFDAAVIHISNGRFDIVNHEGDNHLGGKLIDWEIVESILAPAVVEQFGLREFSRSNPRWKNAFAKLKWAAEEAKIALSHNPSFPISIEQLCLDEGGNPLPFDFDLTQEAVARLAQPFIRRSINICRHAIQAANLTSRNFEKLILVGGPTLAPYVREHLEDATEGLGIPLDFRIDPLTVVAQGAAYYASLQRQPDAEVGRYRNEPSHYQLDLEYNPAGADTNPIVGGKVSIAGGRSLNGFTIEFANPGMQPAWRSPKIPLSPDGKFMTTLVAQAGRTNTFQITLCDPNGQIQNVDPKEFAYTVAVVPTAPPLIHNVGIALADNRVIWFLMKGTPLPHRKRMVLKTAVELRAGTTDVLHIPIIEGQNRLADRNPLIGYLKILGTQIRRNLPPGSDIELTLEVDESRMVKTSATITMLDQDFGTIIELEKPAPDIDRLETEFEQERQRLTELERQASETGDASANQIIQDQVYGEQMLNNVSNALNAAEGDVDAGDKAQKRLLDLRIALDQAEESLRYPALVAKVENLLTELRDLIARSGSKPEFQRLYQRLEGDARRAQQSRNVDLLVRTADDLSSLQVAILREQPDFWVGFFQYLEESRHQMTDQARAEDLFQSGYRAQNANDVPRLRAIVQQVIALLPRDEQARVSTRYNSGLSV